MKFMSRDYKSTVKIDSITSESSISRLSACSGIIFRSIQSVGQSCFRSSLSSNLLKYRTMKLTMDFYFVHFSEFPPFYILQKHNKWVFAGLCGCKHVSVLFQMHV